MQWTGPIFKFTSRSTFVARCFFKYFSEFFSLLFHFFLSFVSWWLFLGVFVLCVYRVVFPIFLSISFFNAPASYAVCVRTAYMQYFCGLVNQIMLIQWREDERMFSSGRASKVHIHTAATIANQTEWTESCEEFPSRALTHGQKWWEGEQKKSQEENEKIFRIFIFRQKKYCCY